MVTCRGRRHSSVSSWSEQTQSARMQSQSGRDREVGQACSPSRKRNLTGTRSRVNMACVVTRAGLRAKAHRS